MRTNLIIIAVCVVLGFLMTFALDFQAKPRSANPATQEKRDTYAKVPDVTLTSLNGEDIRLADFKEKLVLLNIWATWCAPCKVEFPQMLQLANDDEDIVFIALSVDSDKKDVQKFLKSQEQTHLKHANVFIVHDPQKTVAQDVFQVLKYPETIVISPSGFMSDKIIGAVDWLSPDIKKRLEQSKAL